MDAAVLMTEHVTSKLQVRGTGWSMEVRKCN